MGSWNATCNITKLPILYGEKVYGIILEEKESVRRRAGSDYVYSHDCGIIQPVLLIGNYDDYGIINNLEEKSANVFQSWIDKTFIHYLNRLQDSIDDKKNKNEELNWEERQFEIPKNHEEFIRVIERGLTKYYLILIKANVFEKFVNFKRVKEELNLYFNLFSTLKEDFNSEDFLNTNTVNLFLEYEREYLKEIEQAKKIIKLRFETNFMSFLEDKWKELDGILYYRLADFKNALIKNVFGKSIFEHDHETTFLMATLLHLEHLYDLGRMAFTRSSGTGSQDTETAIQKKIIELIELGIKDIDNYYNDDNDPDYIPSSEELEIIEKYRFKYYDNI